jgi:hypothetical protein
MRIARSVIAMAATALCACSLQPRFSPTSVTPQQLLAHYRDATDRCLTPGVYYFRFRTTTNHGDVFVNDYYYEPHGVGKSSDLLVVSTMHGLRSERGRVSGRSWMQTANGLVLPDSLTQTPFDRALSAAAHRPDLRVRMLGITSTAERQYVLEIIPNSWLRQRRYFDAGSFLLREVQTRDYDKVVGVDRYSRYIHVCGELVPTRVDHSDSLSQTYQTTLVRHQRVADPHLLAIPQSRTPFVRQYRLPATLNSMFGPTGILIRIDIQGAPYWFQLDSGASVVTLDRDLVQRLGGHEFGKYFGTKGGAVEYGNAVVPRLDIGPVYATNLVVSVINHDYVKQGVHVVGLLGCDFIASRPLSIDFRRQTVVLGNIPPATDRHWTSVRTPLESCRPTIRARLENQPATLLLDSGSPDTVINEDLYDRIAASVHELDTTRVSFIGGDILAATQYVVPNASAGALSLSPLVTSVVAGGRGQDLNNDGFVGLNVLDKYRIVMDYRHQRTYFQKYGTALQ